MDARLRRYYRLTPPGAQRLAAEVERIRAHSAVAAQRLGLLGRPGVNAAAGLEGRYRRLLALYPAEHRRQHQDEMLGVLMTGARAGQRRPGLADTANLIWGALLIRLRPAPPGHRVAALA